MRSIRKGFKNWLSEKNAFGLIAILSASNDPVTQLQAHHQGIDERAVEELIVHSYYLAKTESIEKGLIWAEVARQASLIGGGAKEYADYLDLRASLLQKLFEEKSKGTDKAKTDNERALLVEALECAIEALQVYQKASLEESLPVAYGRISVLHRALNNTLSAFENRIFSVIGWKKLPDAAEAMSRLIDDLIGLFWSLEREELKRGAEMLLQHTNALQETTQWLDEEKCGNLFDIFGAAYCKLEQEEDALLWWDRAIAQYHKINSQECEFVVWARLQDYAYNLESSEKMVEYGRHCIEIAPNDIESWRLASRYRLLAFAHKVSEQNVDAISAYHCAADLYLQDEDGKSVAGECFLEAGILEEEIGRIDEAQTDIEKVLDLPGGARTFWLAEVVLAKLFWKRRGNLGTAIHYAERAVETSIGMHLGFAERAVSHHLLGILHQSAGNSEEALNRFEALLKILNEDAEQGVVHISPLSWHSVIPPSKSEAALLALVVSAKLNLEAKAQRYLKLFQSYASQSPDNQLADSREVLSDGDIYTEDLQRGIRMLAQADQLLIFDLKQAESILETALPLLKDFGPGLIVAYRDLGYIKLRLEEFEAARVCCNSALQLLAQSPDIFEEIICRQNLGLTEAGSRNLQAAHEQFVRVIQMKEALRVSLTDDEQRFLFLQSGLDTYLMFLGICMELRLFREALETVEKIKSRVLLDLMGQSNKRPIDYRSLSKIKKLTKKRKEWMDDLLLETGTSASSRLDKLMEEDSEKATEWLYTPLRIYEEIDATKRDLQNRNFLLEMESQNTSLSFEDIRELCRAL